MTTTRRGENPQDETETIRTRCGAGLMGAVLICRQMDHGAKTLLKLFQGYETVMVAIHGIKDGIGSEPLFAGNDAIAVEIIEAKELGRRFGHGAATLQLAESSGEEGLGIFQRLGEALNAFGQLVTGHSIFLMHPIKRRLVHSDGGFPRGSGVFF